MSALRRWVWDGVALGYLLSGGYSYDPRLASGLPLSLNQLLGIALGLRLVRVVWEARHQRVRGSSTLAVVLGLASMLLLRLPDSPNPDYGRFKLLSYLLTIVPTLLYVEATLHTSRDLRRLQMLFLVAAVGLSLAAIPLVGMLRPGERLAVLGGGPNVLARVLGTGALIALAFLLEEKTRGRRVRTAIYGVTLALLGFVLVLTGSKAVICGAALAMIAILAASGRTRRTRWLLVSLALLILAPAATDRLVRGLPKDGALVRMLRLPDIGDAFGSYGSRLRYLHGSVEQIRAYPWVGVGTGAWGARLGLGVGPSYPHNIVLEILSELGIAGLLCVVVAFIGFPRARRRDSPFPVLLGLLIFWALNVQVSGDLVDSRYLWWFLMLLEIQTRVANSAARDTEALAGGNASAVYGGIPA